MAAILHFKDLKCWQKALILNRDIHRLTNHLRFYSLKDQIQRASLSIMNNLAEGFGRKSPKERIRFYEYSTASCYEVESMTYLLEELQAVDPEKLIEIRSLTIEIYKMVAALSKVIRSNSTSE